MKKTRLLSLIMIVMMTLALLVSCGKGNETADTASASGSGAETEQAPAASDLEYVKEKGVLVVGVTDFAPMDYQDEDGKWIGFDADLAAKFAESLGVDVEFVEIVWENKIIEIDSKTVDCIWNGMTLTDEVTTAMNCSDPYLNNAQTVIVPSDIADSITGPESCKDLVFAVENGSAGNEAAEENGFTFTAVKDQATALLEVASGTSDAAIIDSLMAAAMVGEGTSYENLTYTIGLTTEEYGVGFRKGSDLTEKFNDFLKECAENGTLDEIAETYGVQASLIK